MEKLFLRKNCVAVSGFFCQCRLAVVYADHRSLTLFSFLVFNNFLFRSKLFTLPGLAGDSRFAKEHNKTTAETGMIANRREKER